VYIGINDTFTDDYFIKYSALERAGSISAIEHPIVRCALQIHDHAPALEIVSLADIPSGTGLGLSGSFHCGLAPSDLCPPT
jgi:D-glycero-alpha-D-manno-heptose-7-phosphate kinase